MLRTIRTKADGFEWIDVINPDADELGKIAAQYNLHPSAVQDCMQPEHLPKFELIDETVFIIYRYFDIDCPRNADTIHELSRKLAIFFHKDFIITIHRKEFVQYDELLKKHTHHQHPFDVLCLLIKYAMNSYETPITKVDSEIDFYESRIFLKKKIPDLLRNLYLIKRKIYVIRKLSTLSKEIIEKLGATNKKSPYFHDLRDHYIKLETLIEEVSDSIQSLLNIYISLSSQRTNEVMRILTVFTAFFLPLTFIVGVYGMNFKFMPELEYPFGYPGVLIGMLIITVSIWIWFKRKGWI
ncbi:MAG: CorA family divalent cation transporter [Bacteroidota bacterium]